MPNYFCINCGYRDMQEVEGDSSMLECPVCGAFAPKDDTPIIAGEK